MASLEGIRTDIESVGKKGHTKETLIVVGTVILVIFAYLTWKAQSSGATTSGDATSGTTGDTGAATDQTDQGIANALGAQDSALSVIISKLTNLNKREAASNKKEKLANERLKKLLDAKKTKKAPATHKSKTKAAKRPVVKIGSAPRLTKKKVEHAPTTTGLKRKKGK